MVQALFVNRNQDTESWSGVLFCMLRFQEGLANHTIETLGSRFFLEDIEFLERWCYFLLILSIPFSPSSGCVPYPLIQSNIIQFIKKSPIKVIFIIKSEWIYLLDLVSQKCPLFCCLFDYLKICSEIHDVFAKGSKFFEAHCLMFVHFATEDLE